MYIKKNELQVLDEIITKISKFTTYEEFSKYLLDTVEDEEKFMKILKKIKKLKIPKKQTLKKEEIIKTDAYTEEEIYEILTAKSNEEIAKEYSLKELKKMYSSIYKRNPTMDKTKANILSTLRNRMHTMKRAEAFQLLAKEREKRVAEANKK